MNVIFYFSGTGNSLFAAKKIQEKIGEARLIPISNSMSTEFYEVDADIIGFVFPVYAYGPPAAVENFISRMSIKKAAYTFVALTHGGGPADTFTYVNRLFKRKKHEVTAWFEIKMPSNYIVGSNTASDEKISKIFSISEPRISQIAEMVAARKNNEIVRSGAGGKVITALVHPLFVKMIPGMDKKFYSLDSCNGCGICVKVCPAGNIRLNSENRPEWLHKCEQCLACINLCPKEAVQFGKNTLKRRRYHHPEIKVAELFNK